MLIVCITMVSAEKFDNIDKNIIINQVKQNHTIYFGEEHLDITDCLSNNPAIQYVVILDTVGNVTDSIRVLDMADFTMPTDKEENTWYQATDANTPAQDVNGDPIPAFITQEPVLSFDIWNLNTDMKAASSVQRGSLIQFKFTTDTNLDDIASRLDYQRKIAEYGSYINIGVVTPSDEQLLKLMTLAQNSGATELYATAGIGSTLDIPEGEAPAYVWPGNLNSKSPDPTGWMTGWRDAGSGQESDYYYKVGWYDVTALCNVNNMFKNRQLQGYTWDTGKVELTPRSISISVSPPSGKTRDAQFTATVTGMPNTAYEIFIFDECPPKITGQICNRPPYIVGTREELAKTNIILDPIEGPYETGLKRVVDCCTQGMNIRQAVPSGDAYPSAGDWEIFEKGTRYYAKIITGPDGRVTVPFYIDTTVMPGTFTIQTQDLLYDLKSTTEMTVSLGAITGAVKDPSGIQKPGNIFYLGDEIWIDGTNSDSSMTYVWLTGQGLDPCGVNLFNPLESKDPIRAVVYDTKDGIANYWRVEPNWDTRTVPVSTGEYKIWMASVDPGCRFCQCDSLDSDACGFGDCFGVDCEEGVCSLLHCPECAAVTSIDITLKEPGLTALVSDTVRSCCDGFPCGMFGGVQEIWVTGDSAGNSCKQLQVWLFGQSQFGLKNYLMTVTPIYCDGTYKFELNKGLLQANGIDLCSIATGKYDVIVQAPGANNIFDIRLGDQQETGERFVMTSVPTDDSKLFLIEGKNSLYGGAAVKALVEGFNQPAIDDLYAHVTFNLSDTPSDGNVDFSADKTQGNNPLTVQFTDTSVLPGVAWNWTRNGVLFSTEQNPKEVFTDIGKYGISLEVTDADGNTKSAAKDSYINVVAAPIGDFSVAPQQGHIDEPIQFTDQSTGTPTSWMWDFGDSGISSLQSPVHSYSSSGTFMVTLMVGNAMGIGAPVKKDIIIVNDKPVADFEADETSHIWYPAQVSFTDMSIGKDITSWLWSFGDGGTTTIKNPVYLYTQPGEYTVSLTVSNNGGTDTEEKSNYITIGTGSQFSIYEGWNHVSVPKEVTDENNTLEKLFADVNTGGIPYAVFDNQENKWVNVTDPDNYLVTPLEAYRVWKDDPGSIEIIPEYKIEGNVITRELQTGWNGIGIMAMQPTPARTVLASLGDSWDKTLLFNPDTQQWEYPIIRGVNDNDDLYPTFGYLIEMNTNGILIGGDIDD